MTTRAGLRTSARNELGDGGAAPTWTDAQLNQWLLEAIREYGRRAPKATTTTIASVALQADYALPADCLRVARVEHPTGFFRVPDPRSGGDVIDPLQITSQQVPRVLSEQLGYDVWGSLGALTLTLLPEPADASSSIKVRYWARWTEPAADGDTLATPSLDDELLVWLVAARALDWLGSEEGKRQRYERQRGSSPDEASGSYRRRYEQALSARESRAAARRLVVRG